MANLEEHLEMEALIPLNLNDAVNMTDLEVQQFRDERGRTILMIAAEAGRLDVVENIISRGEEVDEVVDGETAASLAFSQGHHQVVLTLLKANSKFPHNYQHETASDELKAFVELSSKLHAKVSNFVDEKQESLNEIRETLTQTQANFPLLRHFYDRENNSLLKTSILSKMFAVYEILLSLNIFLAPHENMDDFRLSKRMRKKLSEINLKLSPGLFTNSMMILMRNCKLGPDTPKDRHGEFMKQIRDAFDYLFKIRQIAIVLKIVAASYDFKIIFDFKRDSVTFLDPESEPYVNGLFYTSGRIYIAAKDLLDSKTALNTIGVIAHELCHYAMLLVFKNDAKPYKEKKITTMEKFEKVTNECENNKSHDEIVELVYECYNEERFHAELIVRVPQMIALYYNEEIFNEKREFFLSLFDFYENNCVPQMETKLPKIEQKFNPFKKAEKKMKIQRFWICALIISIIIGATLSVLGLFYIYNPDISYSELSQDDKNLFKNAIVNFYGVDVKFGELFSNDSKIYDFLSSENIRHALKRETSELSNAVMLTYDNFIFLNWSNMTKQLKNKILYSDANFQGQNVSLKKIIKNNSILNLLESVEIKNILKGSSLKISSKTEIKTKFFMERFFIDEDEEIDFTDHYEDDCVDVEHEDVKSFDEILKSLETEKVFLLSSIAGEGKSTTFRHFAIKLKEKFPKKWIQFVDLKKHSEVYKTNKNLNFSLEDNIKKILSHDLLNLTKFEDKVFLELFKDGNYIFLWDGIDEISPIYEIFMLNLTSSIKNLENNFQFISTRPQHSKTFQIKLNITAHKLVPLGLHEIFEFCVKFICFEQFNVDANKFNEIVEIEALKNENVIIAEEIENSLMKLNLSKILFTELNFTMQKSIEILKSVDDEETFRNPLLVRMVTEIATEKKIKISSSLNFYEFYNIFVLKKFSIANKKGKVIQNKILEIQTDPNINIIQIHQAYAFKFLIDLDEIDVLKIDFENLNIFKSIDKLSKEEISQFGILQVYSENDFSFAHKTFAEFFLIKHILESLNNVKKDSTDYFLIFLLYSSILENKGENYKNFFEGFLKSKIKKSDLIKIFKKYYFKMKENSLEEEEEEKENLKTGLHLELLKFSCETYPEVYDVIVKMLMEDVSEEFVIENVDSLLNLTSKDDLFFFFTVKYSDGTTFLHKTFRENPGENYTTFIEKLNKIFTSSQIASIFSMEDDENRNVFSFLLEKFSSEHLNLFCDFSGKKLLKSDVKNLLEMKNDSCGNALYYSAFNDEYEDVFLYVLEKLKAILSENEICDFLLKRDWSCPTILFGLIKNSNIATILTLKECFESVLIDDKIEMRNFLFHRDSEGETIFNKQFQIKYPDKIDVFKGILNETLEENEDILISLKFLEESSRLINFFQNPSLANNLVELRTFEWTYVDFYYIVSKWTEIKRNLRENFKDLLRSKNEDSESLMFDFARLNEDELIFEPFIHKIKNYLNKFEIIKLFEPNNINQTPLMIAASKKNKENLKKVFDFLKSNLVIKDVIKDHLNLKENDLITALQYSTFNENFNAFLFVKDTFEDHFSRTEIVEIFSQVKEEKLSFLNKVLKVTSIENNKIVANYLKELFTSDKIKLQNILKHRDENGSTIFSENENNEKIKIYEGLLNFTFDGSQENFIKNPELLKINSKVAKKLDQKLSIEELRSFKWTSKDFEFILKDLNESYFKTIILSKDNENITLLHEFFAFHEAENLTENLLMKIKNIFSKTEIFDLISSQSPLGKTILMFSSSSKVKILLEFLKKHFEKDDIRKIFLIKSNYQQTALQYSFWNYDEKVFPLIKKIYEENFENFEVQRIILDCHPDYVSFIYYVLKYSSLDRNQEVAIYLKEFLINEKQKLSELLCHRDEDDNTIFTWFKNSKNIFIYEELLKNLRGTSSC